MFWWLFEKVITFFGPTVEGGDARVGPLEPAEFHIIYSQDGKEINHWVLPAHRCGTIGHRT